MKEEVIGEYRVQRHYGGGFHALHENGRSHNCPPDKVILARYHQEVSSGRRGFSNHLKNLFGVRAIIACGKKSITAGKKALGVKGPFKKTERGLVQIGTNVPNEEIEGAIREFWPEEEVRKYIRGEGTLGNITQFTQTYSRAYQAAAARPGHFKGFVDGVYPKFYHLICKRVKAKEVDIDYVKGRLVDRLNRGLPVTEITLRSSKDPEERGLFKQIRAISRNPPRRLLKSSFNETVAQLVNDKDYLKQGKGAKNQLAAMSEEMVHLFLLWSKMLNIETGKIPEGFLVRRGSERCFWMDDKKRIADFRIGNSALEIKSGIGELSKKEAREIRDKYAPGKNLWVTGGKIGSSTVLFNTASQFYEKERATITDAGIEIVDYQWFADKLAYIVGEVKARYQKRLAEVKPRVNNLSKILELNEELALAPCLLLRDSNTLRREWSMALLEGLVAKTPEMGNGN